MLFDLLVVLVILAAIALGAWKGFAWQLAAIVSLIAGFVIGIPLSKPIAPVFGSAAPLNRLVAMAVLYVVVSLGTYVIALVYRKTIERWQLHHWDHHMGGVFGAAKGFLLCLAGTLIAVSLFGGLRDPILRSRMGQVMARTLDAIHPILPDPVHDILHPYVHHLDEPAAAPAVPGTTPAPAVPVAPGATPAPKPDEHHH